jgi:hypothetical protein
MHNDHALFAAMLLNINGIDYVKEFGIVTYKEKRGVNIGLGGNVIPVYVWMKILLS